MKQFFLQFFTWWNGQTLGTRFNTWRNGEVVGTDELGNVYYRSRGGRIDPALGFERRWVIYNGQTEASAIPAGWRGWLHHTVDQAPSQEDYKPRDWQLPHQVNMTGTAHAYRPKGSAVTASTHPKADSTYSAWKP